MLEGKLYIKMVSTSINKDYERGPLYEILKGKKFMELEEMGS